MTEWRMCLRLGFWDLCSLSLNARVKTQLQYSRVKVITFELTTVTSLHIDVSQTLYTFGYDADVLLIYGRLMLFRLFLFTLQTPLISCDLQQFGNHELLRCRCKIERIENGSQKCEHS